jgi:hypothetical protein
MGEARFVNEVTRPGRFTPRAVHHAQCYDIEMGIKL